MSSKIAILAAAVVALGLFAGSAMAQSHPSSIAGTWTAQANQQTGALSIAQGTIGNCRSLSGILIDIPIVGFYCPNTGHFSFVRNDGAGVTFQVYSGNVSTTGTHLFMGGVLSEVITEGGPLGEANFSAVK